MPAKSLAQLHMIYAKRKMYKNKEGTPKMWMWIWEDDMGHMQKENMMEKKGMMDKK